MVRAAAFRFGAAIALTVALLAGVARAEVRRIVVVHTNDLHGQLLPGPDYLTPGEPKPRMGGLAAIAAAVEAERARAAAEGAGFLLLDAGDVFHGSPEGDATRGVAVVECMNLLGYDAVCLGNHEFAYGVEAFEALAKAARFPFLAGNVARAGAGARPLLPGSIVKEVAGLEVAIVAATSDATPRMNRPADTAGLVFSPHRAALRALIERARGEADLVIAVTHIGSQEDLAVAASVTGCALIVGGHDHVALEPAPLVGETLVVQTGELGRRIGRVTLDYDTEKRAVVRREAVLLNLFADAPRSATVAAAVEARRRKELDEAVGTAGAEIRRSFSGESPAGGLVAEVLRATAGADLAIVNQTMIRGGFARGPVTRRDVYACSPFQNDVVALAVSGTALREYLEAALGRPSGETGLEVAGLTARFDPRRPRGERLIEVAVGGAPLADGRVYRVATTDFFADRFASAV
ncbi:MAG TPA: bifunctional UDP-sugar hydrolase/5'-nucleotidase, partial [Planctomycetota bacterium]|nr:bifunctional UDP-sugar hydrolase/5'-nucleotidase [Planctomycetota bacterium]